MSPYRAQIGGAFGGGAGPAASHPIDIGAAIDAAVGGASTLIQNAYMRKQGAAKLAMEQQQRDTEAQRYSQQNEREVARDAFTQSEAKANRERQTIQDAFAREKFDTETALAKEKNDRDFMEKGGSVGKTTISRRPDATASAPPIAQAFSQGNLSAGAPASSSPLTQAPSLGSVPHLNVTSTQDSLGVPRDRTRTPFMEDGQARLGSMDKQGNLYREDGSPVSGKITPYVPPAQSTNVYLPSVGPDGKTVYSVGQSKGTPNIQATDTQKPDAGTLGGAKSAVSIKKQIASNLTQISVIDAAIAELDKHPNAVGMQRGLGMVPMMGEVAGQVNQRIDPEGEKARNAMQNVSSLIIHDRSGAAVTKTEFARLGFIPTDASTYQANRQKLLDLKKFATTETEYLDKAMRTAGTDGAHHEAKGGLDHLTDAQLWDAAKAKHGEAHTLKELGPRPHD